jgi:hypothetical protein
MGIRTQSNLGEWVNLMPSVGDIYNVTLKHAHLRWGTLGASRQKKQRNPLEAYVQIPVSDAECCSILPGTIFKGKSTDGFFQADVRASGSATKRNLRTGVITKYAKQFQGSGDLQLFGRWYHHINAQPGDVIKVEFTSPYDVEFTKI